MTFLSLNTSESLLIICVETEKVKYEEITKEFKDVKLSTAETLKGRYIYVLHSNIILNMY